MADETCTTCPAEVTEPSFTPESLEGANILTIEFCDRVGPQNKATSFAYTLSVSMAPQSDMGAD